MISIQHKLILNLLRKDSRKSLMELAKENNIKIHAVHKAKKYLDRTVIKKYTIILNFENIGCKTRLFLILHPKISHFTKLRDFLYKSSNVNSMQIIDDYCSLIVDILFYDSGELMEFLDALKGFEFHKKEIAYVGEELKKEDFLL